jgi:lactoylglutathione lyase
MPIENHMRLNHIAIRVKNIEAMLGFYCQKLGFEEAFRIFNDDQSLRLIYVHISEGQYLELCLNGLDKPAFDDQTSLGVRHFCFTVEDIAQTRAELIKKGVIFDSEILEMRDKNLAMYVFDPEGNKIEIVQTGTQSPQFKFEKNLRTG